MRMCIVLFQTVNYPRRLNWRLCNICAWFGANDIHWTEKGDLIYINHVDVVYCSKRN